MSSSVLHRFSSSLRPTWVGLRIEYSKIQSSFSRLCNPTASSRVPGLFQVLPDPEIETEQVILMVYRYTQFFQQTHFHFHSSLVRFNQMVIYHGTPNFQTYASITSSWLLSQLSHYVAEWKYPHQMRSISSIPIPMIVGLQSRAFQSSPGKKQLFPKNRDTPNHPSHSTLFKHFFSIETHGDDRGSTIGTRAFQWWSMDYSASPSVIT